jgi:hypothetical protein
LFSVAKLALTFDDAPWNVAPTIATRVRWQNSRLPNLSVDLRPLVSDMSKEFCPLSAGRFGSDGGPPLFFIARYEWFCTIKKVSFRCSALGLM